MTVLLRAHVSKQSNRITAAGSNAPAADSISPMTAQQIITAVLPCLDDTDPLVQRLVLECIAALHSTHSTAGWAGPDARAIIRQACSNPVHVAAVQDRLFHQPPSITVLEQSLNSDPATDPAAAPPMLVVSLSSVSHPHVWHDCPATI